MSLIYNVSTGSLQVYCYITSFITMNSLQQGTSVQRLLNRSLGKAPDVFRLGAQHWRQCTCLQLRGMRLGCARCCPTVDRRYRSDIAKPSGAPPCMEQPNAGFSPLVIRLVWMNTLQAGGPFGRLPRRCILGSLDLVII